MALISLLAILLTAGLLTGVYQNLLCRQVISDLREYVLLVREAEPDFWREGIGSGVAGSGIRLTLMDGEGKVLFDNEADSSLLENHGDRPEVRQAMESGEGESVRRSGTFTHNTFYYAIRLENGSVLRAARDSESVAGIFGSVLPDIFWILAVLILMSVGMSHFLTGKFIYPIERLAEAPDAEGEPGGYEELEPLIEKIRQQRRELVRNTRIRQEFTANVSHELKTPLTAISGYAELIETGLASERDIPGFAKGIHSSADRLLALINDILRLSELDDSETEMEFECLNLFELAKNCAEMLQVNAAKQGVEIRVEGEDCWISGNRQMAEELLYNLCDNAVRYNVKGGTVNIRVRKAGSDTPGAPGRRRILLQVSDTGIGIPKEHQERIFERFYRVDKSRSREIGGTGLGLAIVKHIVARHDADMELESKAGSGTRISVSFSECPPPPEGL